MNRNETSPERVDAAILQTIEEHLARTLDFERWSKDQHDAGNPLGVMGIGDALMEQVLIAEDLETMEATLDSDLRTVCKRLRRRWEQQVIADEIALFEQARQVRIAAGEEMVCRVCGCSDTRACLGGCRWAAPGLCSRCA